MSAATFTIERDSWRGWTSDKRWIASALFVGAVHPATFWTKNRSEALLMSQEEAERLAHDWQIFANVKGFEYRYTATPMQEHDA